MLAVVVMVGVLTLTMASSFLKEMSVGSNVPLALAESPADAPQYLFYDFRSWHSSSTRKADDHVIDALYWLRSSGTVRTFFDINGDGLTDILYMNENTPVQSSPTSLWGFVYVVFLNTGSNNFQIAYKCVDINDGLWYGDCAA